MSTPDNPPIELISRGLMVWRSRILLCRNTRHGYTYLPGGHIDFGESARDALIREFDEETGLRVDPGPPLLICEHAFEQRGTPKHEWTVVFHVEHPQSRPDPGTDPDAPPEVVSREPKLEFLWAEWASLVEMDVRPEPIRAWLVSGGEVRDGVDPTPAWLSDV